MGVMASRTVDTGPRLKAARREDERVTPLELFFDLVFGLAISTAIGVALLVGASFLDGLAQGGLWVLALALDLAGPYFFGSGGWQLAPGHFAERHGLVIIIALGESIVALGVGAEGALTV